MSVLLWLLSLVFAIFGASSLNIVDPNPTPTPTPAALTFEQRPIAVGDLTIEIPYPVRAAEPEAGTAEVDGCRVPETSIDIIGGSALRFLQVPADCAVESRAPGNGYYGYFRTVDDVPDATDQRSVQTPIGIATVVTYPYYECTNSCEDGGLTVAIIALDAPADSALPTLQIFQPVLISNGESAEIDLASYVAGIQPG